MTNLRQSLATPTYSPQTFFANITSFVAACICQAVCIVHASPRYMFADMLRERLPHRCDVDRAAAHAPRRCSRIHEHIHIHEHKARTNEPTNKHNESQYLLAQVGIIRLVWKTVSELERK